MSVPFISGLQLEINVQGTPEKHTKINTAHCLSIRIAFGYKAQDFKIRNCMCIQKFTAH